MKRLFLLVFCVTASDLYASLNFNELKPFHKVAVALAPVTLPTIAVISSYVKDCCESKETRTEKSKKLGKEITNIQHTLDTLEKLEDKSLSDEDFLSNVREIDKSNCISDVLCEEDEKLLIKFINLKDNKYSKAKDWYKLLYQDGSFIKEDLTKKLEKLQRRKKSYDNPVCFEPLERLKNVYMSDDMDPLFSAFTILGIYMPLAMIFSQHRIEKSNQ